MKLNDDLYKLNITEHYSSDIEIKFNGYKPGFPIPNFYKSAGSHDYLTISGQRDDNLKILILGYNKRVYQYEATLRYFFSGNTLIMGQYLFRREKESISFLYLKEKIFEKYKLPFSKNSTYNDEFMIKDKKGNILNAKDDGFNVEVSIYNPSQSLMSNIIPPGGISNIEEFSGKAASITF
ncbi:MAG: hypothetical protein K9H12_16105 [Bacteroidales bacterium]|nr:hypothetical protein [Bacteroidales bacterium]